MVRCAKRRGKTRRSLGGGGQHRVDAGILSELNIFSFPNTIISSIS
jgi:hypothetical protein